MKNNYPPKEEINKLVKEIASQYGSGCNLKLFDPVQTHCIYHIDTWKLDKVKEKLRKIGAKNFRVVGKKTNPYVTLCFAFKQN